VQKLAAESRERCFLTRHENENTAPIQLAFLKADRISLTFVAMFGQPFGQPKHKSQLTTKHPDFNLKYNIFFGFLAFRKNFM